MSFISSFVPYFSVWHILISSLVTFAAILSGCIYTYVRRKTGTPVTCDTDQQSSEVQNEDCGLDQKEDIKWPSGRVVATNPCQKSSSPSDPIDYCNHLQRQIKQTQHRITRAQIEATMTPEQRQLEREIQRKQLEEVFRLMEEQKDKFGVKDVDDIEEQLKLYIQ